MVIPYEAKSPILGPIKLPTLIQTKPLPTPSAKNELKEIQFASGRIEKVNDPIVIKGEEDWEKVKIAVLPSEVTGLKQVGRIYAVGRPNFGRSLAKKEQIALDKARKEAASKGCHLILIESRNLDTDNDLILTAVIYSF